LAIEHPSLATPARGPGYPGSAGYDAPMRRLACLVGFFVLASPALWGADAVAEPRALLDAPRAEDVAVAGGEVLVAATTDHGAVRVTAVPLAGGPAVRRLTVRSPGRDWTAIARLVSSDRLAALLVTFDDPEGNFRVSRVYAGPPQGPFSLVRRVHRPARETVWIPVDVDVHADRLLIQELRLPDVAVRFTVRSPDASPVRRRQRPVSSSTALAGDLVANLRVPRGAPPSFWLVDWRTGEVRDSIALGEYSEDMRGRDLDLTEDGRLVAVLDGRLVSASPGETLRVVPGAEDGSRFSSPRFAGDRVAVLAGGRFDTYRPYIVHPAAGTRRAVGPPSTEVTSIAAGERTVAWLANGCVIAAEADDPSSLDALPPGPCPRAEVVVEEGDQVVRGRTLRVVVTCVAAPDGCRGAALLGRRGWAGTGRFHVAAGERRSVRIRVSPRGMRSIRRQLRRCCPPVLRLGARVADGRVGYGRAFAGVLISRIR
jgi:hypothetical protein